MKYRHEQKYLINYRDYKLVQLRLKDLLARDENVSSDGAYTVRSLYFDDYYNRAYHDKYMGVPNRVKYRIRIYNQSENTIRLERKVKNDQYILKQSALLTRDNVNNILQGNYDFLLQSSDDLHKIFYHECVSNLMRPRVMVEYEREPYVVDAGNVRVTFDSNIRAGLEGFDIFNCEMPMVEALDPGLLVMEVKFTEFLPNIIRRVLPNDAADYAAVSKYILCCDKTMHKRYSDV